LEAVNALTRQLGTGGPDDNQAQAGHLIQQERIIQSINENQRGEIRLSEIANCLSVGGGKPGQGYPAVQIGSSVRRLTPLECERLMGWPDNYTANGLNDEGTTVDLATTNRYRICGNGIVSNVTQWIGERLP
jgi:DNA (cytosine-5)-methyltransferase 1